MTAAFAERKLAARIAPNGEKVVIVKLNDDVEGSDDPAVALGWTVLKFTMPPEDDKPWLKEHKLIIADKKDIQEGRMLHTSHVNVVHKMARALRPNLGGLQRPVISQAAGFEYVPDEGLQINQFVLPGRQPFMVSDSDGRNSALSFMHDCLLVLGFPDQAGRLAFGDEAADFFGIERINDAQGLGECQGGHGGCWIGGG